MKTSFSFSQLIFLIAAMYFSLNIYSMDIERTRIIAEEIRSHELSAHFYTGLAVGGLASLVLTNAFEEPLSISLVDLTVAYGTVIAAGNGYKLYRRAKLLKGQLPAVDVYDALNMVDSRYYAVQSGITIAVVAAVLGKFFVDQDISIKYPQLAVPLGIFSLLYEGRMLDQRQRELEELRRVV